VRFYCAQLFLAVLLRYKPSLPLQHALWHELCDPSQMSVVCRLFVMSSILVLGGFLVVVGGMLKMF